MLTRIECKFSYFEEYILFVSSDINQINATILKNQYLITSIALIEFQVHWEYLLSGLPKLDGGVRVAVWLVHGMPVGFEIYPLIFWENLTLQVYLSLSLSEARWKMVPFSENRQFFAIFGDLVI